MFGWKAKYQTERTEGNFYLDGMASVGDIGSFGWTNVSEPIGNSKGDKTMKNTKITLTDIEKEKLMVCVGLVANNFEIKRYEVEKELNKIEKEGGRDDRLLDLIDYYRERRRFYNELEQKVKHAIENNQL